MNNIQDKAGWCGLPNIWTTSSNDNLTRACQGHDMSMEKNLYSGKRQDELFFQRLDFYSEQENNFWLSKVKPKIYKALVRAYRKYLEKIK